MAVPLITYISTRHVGSFGSSPPRREYLGNYFLVKQKLAECGVLLQVTWKKWDFLMLVEVILLIFIFHQQFILKKVG